MSTKTDARTRLTSEWDRIREGEQTATQALAQSRAALTDAHERDVAEVAAAVRKGRADPDVGTNEQTAREDVARLETVTEGIACALTTVEREIAAAVQKELGTDFPTDHIDVDPPEPDMRPAGEIQWSRYEDATTAVIARKREGVERKELLRRYDAAIDKINAAKSEHLRKGLPAESFQPSDYVDERTLADANPPGSGGAPRQTIAAGRGGDMIVAERGRL